MPAHVSPVAPVGKHMESGHTSGDRLRLFMPNTKARQQKGEKEDAKLDIV
jgi:hypothetical protein